LLARQAVAYFSEVLIEVNLVLRLVPRPLTTAMIASEMPAAIQAVFDGGGAGFILHETRNQILHQLNSVHTWLVELGSDLTGVLSTVTMSHPTVGGLRRS
jgi:hypothetical protein